MSFVLASRQILGWSQSDLAQKLNVPVDDVVLVETMAETAKADFCERAVRWLLNWVAEPALFRGARGLLGLTQREVAKRANISPNTYTKFEHGDFDGASPAEAGTMAKVFAFFASKGIAITFSEENGMGVALKALGSHSLHLTETRGA